MRGLRLTWCSAALAAAALVRPGDACGQFRDPPTPAAYALEGVTVVRADGSRTDSVTLVIRDGRVEALGPGVTVPADARVLEGDSLFVYPGFVDAYGRVDHEFPEGEVDRSEVASWNPPRSVQGFQPHRRLVDALTATGEGVADQRKQGIVAAAVHPEGRLMPGRGAVLILRADAEVPAGLVARPVLGPVMSFRGAPGVYPATLFAVIAFYRQMFENARHYSAQRRAFADDGEDVPPPAWDPDLEVLLNVMDGRTPVFFAADLARDIQRALQLARQYDLRLVIVGGEEAWKVADELQAADVPVLVSLDFPEPERWEPEEEAEVEDEPEGAEAEDQPAAADAEDETGLDAATLREKQRIEDAYANAGRLASAGVTFALTSGGGEANVLEGARKTVEYGLAEGSALAALTATPARLLGVENMVRLGVGRPATFVVADGPLFVEGTGIRYTFVDGVLEEAAAKGGAGGEAPTVDVTGSWDFTFDTQGQTMAVKVVLEQEGASFEGTMTSSFGEGKVVDGVVSANSIEFVIVLSVGGESMNVDLTGTVEGDQASGDGESPMGPFTWKAERTGGPEEETER